MTTNFELPPIPEKNFFSIGEVSRIVQLPSYVLRYWESQFKNLRPMRRNSGQRKYIKHDIETIFHIKELLHNKKFTIEGAKKFLSGDHKKAGTEGQLNVNMGPVPSHKNSGVLKEVKSELEDLMNSLKK